eukprot:scaffold392180_cov75-Attheya_sp.AAC.1
MPHYQFGASGRCDAIRRGHERSMGVDLCSRFGPNRTIDAVVLCSRQINTVRCGTARDAKRPSYVTAVRHSQ